MRRILLVVAVLLAGLTAAGPRAQVANAASGAEECAPRRLYRTLWCDNFDTLDTAGWTVKLPSQGGTASIVGDELAIRANPGPRYVEVTRSSAAGPVFPPPGTPYELEVKFHYVSIGSNGDGFYSLAGSAFSGSVHMSTSPMGVTSGCGSGISKASNTLEHIARFTVEPGPGTRVHLTTLSSPPVTVDGPACGAAPAWPSAFLIGHNLTGGNFAWTNINVDYVRVDVPCRETGTVSTPVATAHGALRGVDPAIADTVQNLNCDVVVANGL